MLVLTRRPGEQIVIANNIRITVVSVGPGRVKIGVEAPPNVTVNRQEIHDRIQHEQTDVLAAVGRTEPTDEPSPTIVAAGDTSTKLNSVVERYPAPNPVPPAAPTQVSASERLARFRTPRKPR